MFLALALLLAQPTQPWEPTPVGLSDQLWQSLTRDQKIHVYVRTTDPSRQGLTTDSAAAATAAIRAQLKDPDSAKFSGVKRRAALDYCGFVNARNSFGGYSGDSLFFANSKWTVILPPEASNATFC